MMKNGTAWGKVLVVALLAFGGWRIYHASITAHFGADAEAELRTLASGVRPGEVVMYSTTECQYCVQAKSWLTQYGFAFEECNMSVDARCESEFRSYNATGTPYLVVRGHHMKDGFDSDEFVALLKR